MVTLRSYWGPLRGRPERHPWTREHNSSPTIYSVVYPLPSFASTMASAARAATNGLSAWPRPAPAPRYLPCATACAPTSPRPKDLSDPQRLVLYLFTHRAARGPCGGTRRSRAGRGRGTPRRNGSGPARWRFESPRMFLILSVELAEQVRSWDPSPLPSLLLPAHAQTCNARAIAPRPSGCATGHPGPLAPSGSRRVIPFAATVLRSLALLRYRSRASSHNDLTPLQGYRGLLACASLSLAHRRSHGHISGVTRSTGSGIGASV
jgi:hypothetical protein